MRFCYRPEVADDDISGGNVKIIEGYALLNLEVASSTIFRYITKNHFVTVAVEAARAADIVDSVKRKHIRASLKNLKCCKFSGFCPASERPPNFLQSQGLVCPDTISNVFDPPKSIKAFSSSICQVLKTLQFLKLL